jgi:hypothetical protein
VQIDRLAGAEVEGAECVAVPDGVVHGVAGLFRVKIPGRGR